MGISAEQGPSITYGQAPGDYNGQRAPSLYDQGAGLLDPRTLFTYQPGQSEFSPVCGWYSGGGLVCIDAVPAALAANNIAASQSPGAGAITLVSSSGAGVTVGASVVNAATGALVTGLLALDGAGGRVSYGQTATIQLWDPAKMLSRCLRFVSGGNDSGITFTVTGFDIYGQPMTETITGANAGTANGAKAWKYISTITHSGSVAGTLTIGTRDVFGFPLRQDIWGYADIIWNNAFVTANTGFTAADTTSPATATTGDVRGTYGVQSASDGTKRLVMFLSIPPSNAGTVAGVLGVTQF
jgi:hypothetical protein